MLDKRLVSTQNSERRLSDDDEDNEPKRLDSSESVLVDEEKSKFNLLRRKEVLGAARMFGGMEKEMRMAFSFSIHSKHSQASMSNTTRCFIAIELGAPLQAILEREQNELQGRKLIAGTWEKSEHARYSPLSGQSGP